MLPRNGGGIGTPQENGRIAPEIPLHQPFHRNHGPIVDAVQPPEAMVRHRLLGGLHVLFHGGGPGRFQQGQTARFHRHQPHLVRVHLPQLLQGLPLAAQGFLQFPQMGHGRVQLRCLFCHEGVQLLHGPVGHPGPDIGDGHVQLPQHKNGAQGGALEKTVIPVAVLPHHRRTEQADFIVPHQCFFMDAVGLGKFPNGIKVSGVLGHGSHLLCRFGYYSICRCFLQPHGVYWKKTEGGGPWAQVWYERDFTRTP